MRPNGTTPCYFYTAQIYFRSFTVNVSMIILKKLNQILSLVQWEINQLRWVTVETTLTWKNAPQLAS